MSKTRNLSDLLDANGDVKTDALDNVPPSNDASALTTGTLPDARLSTNVTQNSSTQTLTNKTLDASSNTLSNIPNSALTNSSITINGSATSLGGSATINTDVVNDTTPQLGGNLDTNGNDINFSDNDKAQFGASQDLQIYHDGSNSIITDLGTGDLLLGGNKIKLTDASGAITYAEGSAGSQSVSLFHTSSAKLTTTATGATVTGTLTATAFSGDGSALTGISGGENTPAFEAYPSGTRFVSSGTVTKIIANTERFDTDGCYDNATNYRFTPTEAGKYFCYASISYVDATNNTIKYIARLHKNGSVVLTGSQNFSDADRTSCYVGGVIEFNGSTDYLEFYTSTDSGSTRTVDNDNSRTYFGAYKLIGA